MATSPIPSISEIQEIVRFSHVSSIRKWLRANGKPYSTKPNETLAESLLKWLKSGKIDRSDIQNAVWDVEESGGKKIFIRVLKGPLPKNEAEFDEVLKKGGTPLIARSKRSVVHPLIPTLNHIIWDSSTEGTYIWIKYSELQEDVITDYETLKSTTSPRLVYVVIKIDISTGLTEFRFDPPSVRHRHKDGLGKSSARIYEQFYFDKIQDFFPKVTVEHYGLNDVTEFIVLKGKKFFRINRESATTSGGGKQIYSAGKGDVRDLRARKGAEKEDGKNWIFNDLVGYWISQRSGGKLTSDLFMRLFQEGASVQFQRDCLGMELNYALGKIRQIKEEV